MIRIIYAVLFLMLTISARADTLLLASKYDVVGTNPGGSEYKGTATIDVISDSTFAIRWNIAGAIFKGFGMRMNDALAATYVIDGDPGLIIYKVDESGTLNGLWSVRGRNGSGTERLTPLN
jgi:hypothetical protein